MNDQKFHYSSFIISRSGNKYYSLYATLFIFAHSPCSLLILLFFFCISWVLPASWSLISLLHSDFLILPAPFLFLSILPAPWLLLKEAQYSMNVHKHRYPWATPTWHETTPIRLLDAQKTIHAFSHILALNWKVQRDLSTDEMSHFIIIHFYQTLDTVIVMSPNVMKLNHQKSPKVFKNTSRLYVICHDQSWYCQTNWQR